MSSTQPQSLVHATPEEVERAQEIIAALKSGQLEVSDLEMTLGESEGRPFTLSFDGEDVTSNAGVLLLLQFAEKTGFIDELASALPDPRCQNRAVHDLRDMVRQLLGSDALGLSRYCHHDDLRNDPAFIAMQTAAKKLPSGKERKRLPGKDAVHRMIQAIAKSGADKTIVPAYLESFLINQFIKSYNSNPQDVIYVDIDATHVAVHGNQEGNHFHGRYRQKCLIAQLIYVQNRVLSFNMFSAKYGAAYQAAQMLKRVIKKLNKAFPDSLIVVRGDADYGKRDEILRMLETFRKKGLNVRYLCGFPDNSRLQQEFTTDWPELEENCRQSQQPVRRFKSLMWKTKTSWKHPRRIVSKIECLPKPDDMIGSIRNPRHLVTNLSHQFADPQKLYETHYCQRGNAELWIRESKLDLSLDQASSTSLQSNYIRSYLKLAAHHLLCQFRDSLLGQTSLATATVGTIQKKLFKVGAKVYDSVRRLKFSLAKSCPNQVDFMTAYLELSKIPQWLTNHTRLNL